MIEMSSKRSSEEHEASRRLKTEFLVQMDGAAPGAADRHVVVIAATNLPDQLDDAFVRRMPKVTTALKFHVVRANEINPLIIIIAMI
jgi:SpoVK/Ycf46/Vps4 family AAA+-type ATPase